MIKKWFWTILDIIVLLICIFELRLGKISMFMFMFDIILIMITPMCIYWLWIEDNNEDDFIS